MKRSVCVNPLPFLYALADSIKDQGTDWVRTDHAKAILYTLKQMAYGQGFHLDGMVEYGRLQYLMEDS